MSKMLRRAGVFLAGACLLVTGCESDDVAPGATPSASGALAASPQETWDDKVPSRTFTAVLVQVAWSKQAPEDKEVLCTSSNLLTPRWAARLIRRSSEGQDLGDVDYRIAAQMFRERCLQEGY